MINIKELRFGYTSKNTLFSSLDFELKQGNVYGLLGKNGAGKSSLLKLMCGLLYAQEGSILYNDQDVTKRLPSVLSEMYLIPEEFHLPDLKGEAYERLYSVFYPRFDKQEFDNILVDFEVDKNLRLSRMSYGQKKKFMIAFAIATQCSLILMDEPTNGLDIPSKSKFRKVVASATNENRSFIISTHQVRDLENLIDPVVIIDNGKIIFDESIDTISTKLRFQKTDKDDLPQGHTFHTEPVFGGNYCLTDNPEGVETPVDFELLFNSVLSNRNEIVEHLKN